MDRLRLWLSTMQLPLNGPLLLIGAVGLVAAGVRAAEDDLARVAIVWLAPLAGIFGFLAGIAYPYYRFFNTTLAWVLLVGIGAYFVVRFLAARALVLGVLGAVAVGVVFVANFSENLHLWNDPGEAWLVGDQRQDLAALKGALEESGENRPVVFVLDTVKTRTTQIYGDMKFTANISRSGLPHGYLDRGFVYLGPAEYFLMGQPTDGPNDFYRQLSEDTLADAEAGIERTGKDPIVVAMDVFNPDEATRPALRGPTEIPGAYWLVANGTVTDVNTREVPSSNPEPEAGLGHLLLVVVIVALLLLPGYLLLRWTLPDAGFAEALGLVPALAMSATAVSGLGVLAVARSELSTGLAWVAVALALVVPGAVLGRTRTSST